MSQTVRIDWGDGVDVLTRAMCGGCLEFKRRLAEAGIAFHEWDIDTADGRAAAAWYDSPALLPTVAVHGQLIEANGDPAVLFDAVKSKTQGRHDETTG